MTAECVCVLPDRGVALVRRLYTSCSQRTGRLASKFKTAQTNVNLGEENQRMRSH